MEGTSNYNRNPKSVRTKRNLDLKSTRLAVLGYPSRLGLYGVQYTIVFKLGECKCETWCVVIVSTDDTLTCSGH